MNKILLAEDKLGFCTNDHELLIEALTLEGYAKLAGYIDGLKELATDYQSQLESEQHKTEDQENMIDRLRDDNDKLTDKLTTYQEIIQKLDKELTRLTKSIQTTS